MRDKAQLRRQRLKAEVIRIHETEGGTLRAIVERITSDPAERVIAYATARGYYNHDQEQCVYAMYRPLQRRRQKITDVSTTRLALQELHEYIEAEYQALVAIAEGKPQVEVRDEYAGQECVDFIEMIEGYKS